MRHLSFSSIRPTLALPAGARIRWLMFAALALQAMNAYAACTTAADFILPVGNVKKDSACRFDSIQKAIDNAVCPGSTILITPSLTYTAQRLTINSKQLLLYGGKTCADTPTSTPGPQVSISGTGNGGSSVVAMNGKNNVMMQNLFVTGSQGDAGDYGGGIYFDGQGSLSLANVTVYNNLGGYGGGIYLKGEKGGWAQLDVLDNTLIENNTAYHDGGGIYADEDARVVLTGRNTSLYSNEALGINAILGMGDRDGFGGGIMLARAAEFDLSALGVPGFGGGAGLGAVDGNKALRGGGIAEVASGGSCTESRISAAAADALHPVQISGNHASFEGGAIYLRPDASDLPFGFCPVSYRELNDFRIASNTAADGAAIYLDWDTAWFAFDVGSSLFLNWLGEDPALPDNPKIKSKITCVGAPGCNTIEDNIAEDDKGNPTKGSIIFVGISGQFWANRVAMRHNVGDNLIYLRGDNDDSETTRLSNALIVDNTFARSILTQENDDAPVFIDSSTIAHNKVKGSFVLNVHSGLALSNSLLGESAKALNYSGASSNLHVDWVVAGNASGLPLSDGVLQADPGFADPDHGDFILADKSIALDFAPTNTALQSDLVGQVRNADLADVADRFGVRDLGAYEREANVAAAASGAAASASSEFSAQFPASSIIDGDRTGAAWSNGGGWNDATLMMFPDTATVQFSGVRSINSIVVYTLQDNFLTGGEPSDTSTFSAYGLTDFDVQILDPATSAWTTVKSIAGNHLVKRTIALPNIVSASAVRIVCKAAIDGQYSRIVEVEAFGG